MLILAGLTVVIALHPYGARFAIGTWPVPNGTPWTYQLESGFVPALTVLTLLGAVGSMYHLHNCHEDGCWRIGKHKVDGTPWCSHHHENAREQARKTETARREARLDELVTLLLAEAEARKSASAGTP